MSVTFQRLATRIQPHIEDAPGMPSLTQNQLLFLMNHVFFQIGDALSSGEDVYLEGFGRFYPDCKPPRKFKSNITEEIHTTDYKVFVKFNPFKQLNSQVSTFLAQLGLTDPEEDNDGTDEAPAPERKTG